MTSITEHRIRFLIGFAAYFALLWLLWDTVVVYPLKIFVVLLHEISHGLMAVVTGGSIERIILTENQGGLCQCPGGSPFFTLSAGYLGSLVWGAIILSLAREHFSWARAVTVVIGAAVVAISVFFVRNAFGILFGLAFGAALFLAGRRLSLQANATLLTVLGLTSCLYAILDIKSDIFDRPEAPSDAHMLAQLTSIPTVVWGAVWIAVALAVSWMMFRHLLRGAERSV